ncbi:ABC transporter permease [Actinorhabdospora filicis]|uniref:ABC transporter permease n=1 Tax=Actinorhabdospora filicis TaxID=1785913 RepID=A0A9W6SKK9_9ACTN|nr:ABC-2 family transporter protein [Actinorhabdospora filicis]GLZ77652.1 ABC transporter permease [Actinorhabdospora filicis]
MSAWALERWSFVDNRIRTVFAYRVDILAWLVGIALHLVLMVTLWRAVYAGRPVVDGVPLAVMTTYASIAALQALLNNDDTVDWLTERIRDGKVGADLARPVGLLQQQVCGQAAQLVMKVPMIVLVGLVAMLAVGVSAPAAPGAFLLSTALGWAVNCCLGLLLAATAFWTLETDGTMFLYFVLSGLLSGALVPLWVMPSWLGGLLSWLPWQAVVYTPVSIYIGRLSGSAMWSAIGVQALWAAVLAGLVVLVWRRAVHRVVVQGG